MCQSTDAQINATQSSEIDPCLNSQLFFYKLVKVIQQGVEKYFQQIALENLKKIKT